MPAAMNGVDAKNGKSQIKLDPYGSAHGRSAHGGSVDLKARVSSTGPAGPRRARALSIYRSVILLGVLGVACSGSALASDGVLEINQTCAVQTGCFAGDTAGLPVTISASGSYRLTSNLVVPNENTSGIIVSTDNVSIDLAGFEIRGPVVCTDLPPCVPNAGTGSGVEAIPNTLSGISVRNGSIRGMGNFGVSLGVQSEVTNLRVRSNRADGIHVSSGSNISGNTAYRNGGHGIFSTSGSTISGNTAYQNNLNGIFANTHSTVSGNTSFQNQGQGIFAGTGSIVAGNTASDNGDDGIASVSGTTVWGNTVRSNTGFGLNLASQSGYRENVMSLNTAGTVIGGVNLGNNLCDGVICP